MPLPMSLSLSSFLTLSPSPERYLSPFLPPFIVPSLTLFISPALFHSGSHSRCLSLSRSLSLLLPHSLCFCSEIRAEILLILGILDDWCSSKENFKYSPASSQNHWLSVFEKVFKTLAARTRKAVSKRAKIWISRARPDKKAGARSPIKVGARELLRGSSILESECSGGNSLCNFFISVRYFFTHFKRL